MLITLVWAGDKHASELYTNRIRAAEHVRGMRLVLGHYTTRITTRPNLDGEAELVGIRPIYSALSPTPDWLVGVWLEYGGVITYIDRRDCKLTTYISSGEEAF